MHKCSVPVGADIHVSCEAIPFLLLCQVIYPTNLSFLFIYSMGAQPVSNIYTQPLYCELLLIQKTLNFFWYSKSHWMMCEGRKDGKSSFVVMTIQT